jgi:outer membrane lipoprotein carrier protein
MKMRHYPALLLAAMLAVCTNTVIGQTDVRSIAQEVDSHYNHLHTMQAQFVESYRGGGVSREESGMLWLKRPRKMRWEYHQPREKLFVSDGKNAWFYIPGEPEVRKSPIKNLEDLRSPLAYMLGQTRLEKEFDALSLAPDVRPIHPGDISLRGIPKAMPQVSQIVLEITPAREIARIVVDEIDGSTTEYRFSEHKENLQIDDQRFRFAPPAGTEIITSDIQ